jgi:hypothetical protein
VDSDCPHAQRCSHSAVLFSGAQQTASRAWHCVTDCDIDQGHVHAWGCFPKASDGGGCLHGAMCWSEKCLFSDAARSNGTCADACECRAGARLLGPCEAGAQSCVSCYEQMEACGCADSTECRDAHADTFCHQGARWGSIG